MEERSKNKEIYEQKYLFDELLHNPLLCAEAIGYLKALTQYFPSEQKWVETEITVLMLALLFHSL